MPSSIRIALKGPGPSGPAYVRFNTKCPNDDFKEDLAAAVGLRRASELDAVSFTSFGEVHGHVAMPNKLRKLVEGEEEGSELGLQVVDGELRVQWQPCILRPLQTIVLQCTYLAYCSFSHCQGNAASFLQEMCSLTGQSNPLQQHVSRCSLVIPQPLLPVPQRQPQTRAAIRALGRQKHQARSSFGTAISKRSSGRLSGGLRVVRWQDGQ